MTVVYTMSHVYQLVAIIWRQGEPQVISSHVVYSTRKNAEIGKKIFALGITSDEVITPEDIQIRELSVV